MNPENYIPQCYIKLGGSSPEFRERLLKELLELGWHLLDDKSRIHDERTMVWNLYFKGKAIKTVSKVYAGGLFIIDAMDYVCETYRN